MFENNYIQFHYNNGKLSIKAFPPIGKPADPATEAEKAAFRYYKRLGNKHYVLCLSGGLDSQVMAEAFLRAGVPFSASIWKYKKNLNLYDIKSAIEFCEKNKIDYEIEECDLELFYGNNLHFHYGVKYLCNSPQIAVHLYFLEKLSEKSNRAFFLPWQPPSFYWDSHRKSPLLRVVVDFTYLSYLRFFCLNHIAGSPYFLICRSALLYSFLNLPVIKKVMNGDMDIQHISPYKLKTIIYKQGGFQSKPQKGKFTGFDKIKGFLRTKYGMDYDEAFRRPLEKAVPFVELTDVYVYPVWRKNGA